MLSVHRIPQTVPPGGLFYRINLSWQFVEGTRLYSFAMAQAGWKRCIERTTWWRERNMSYQVVEPIIPFDWYSNFNRLKWVTTWCLRFINNCVGKLGKPNSSISTSPMLTTAELHASEKFWVGLAQHDDFKSEIIAFQSFAVFKFIAVTTSVPWQGGTTLSWWSTRTFQAIILQASSTHSQW